MTASLRSEIEVLPCWNYTRYVRRLRVRSDDLPIPIDALNDGAQTAGTILGANLIRSLYIRILAVGNGAGDVPIARVSYQLHLDPRGSARFQLCDKLLDASSL